MTSYMRVDLSVRARFTGRQGSPCEDLGSVTDCIAVVESEIFN